MKGKYRRWAIGTGIILVAVIVLNFFLFQPKTEKNKDIQISAAETSKEQTDSLSLRALKLFTADDLTLDKKEFETIEVNENLSVEKELVLIADELSKKQFNNLPIEVQRIEKIEGKTIAIINLREKEKKEDGDKTWIQYLNAGSTGSAIVFVTFEESFLQKDLQGEWVDGIKIIHEGKDMEEMDHFPGTQIIYRNK